MDPGEYPVWVPAREIFFSNFLAQESVSISQIVDKLLITCFATKGYLGQDKVVKIRAIFYFMAKRTSGKGVLRGQTTLTWLYIPLTQIIFPSSHEKKGPLLT